MQINAYQEGKINTEVNERVLKNTFDGRRFCIPKFTYSTLQQTTRHWWSPTSSFGITSNREAASL